MNASLRKKFPINALPTLFIVDPEDESVALRWVGAASVPQLEILLGKGAERVALGAGAESSGGPHDKALDRADRAYGAGRDSLAVIGYREAIAAAPPDWPHFGRAVESLFFALQRLDSCEAVVRHSLDLYPRVRNLPSVVTVAAGGLDCVYSLPAEHPLRAEAPLLEERAREVAADTLVKVSADDRSGLYASLVGARESAGDDSGHMAAARTWAAYLERSAAGARTPEQRTVFDSHRLGAYLELNEPERAIAMLEQSEKDFPDDYNPPARLAVTYRALKRWDQGLAASDRALDRAYGPRKLGILQTRADLYMGKGEKERARETLAGAIRTAEALPQGQRSEAAIASLRKKLDSLN